MALNIETKIIQLDGTFVRVITERRKGEKEVITSAFIEDDSEPYDSKTDYNHKKGRRSHREFCEALDPKGRRYVFNPDLNGDGGYEPLPTFEDVIEAMGLRLGGKSYRDS